MRKRVVTGAFTAFLSGLILLLGMALTYPLNKAWAVSPSEYWSIWDASNEGNFQRMDHRLWDSILTAYLVTDHPSGINRFRYGGMSGADQDKLNRYIAHLTAQDPRTYSRLEQKAYWINLYNALVVQLILEHFPIDSIKDIGVNAKGLGPWDQKLVEVASTRLSLNDIEHRILRPLWKDHKLHFALSCGSLSCPNLQPRAFSSTNIRTMLRDAAREYINHPRGVHLESGHLRASKIFSWYQSDFAGNQKTLIKVMVHYLDDKKALYLLGFQGEIEYVYDWRLNSPES